MVSYDPVLFNLNYLYSGAFAVLNSADSSAQICVPFDTFSLIGTPILADSILAAGNVPLGIEGILALDANNQIISIDNVSIAFNIDSLTSTNNISSGRFDLYPNPASNKLEVQVQNIPSYPLQISIIDISDQILSRQTLNASPKMELDISPLSSGMYFIQLQDGQQSWVQKFVKE